MASALASELLWILLHSEGQWRSESGRNAREGAALVSSAANKQHPSFAAATGALTVHNRTIRIGHIVP
jgi:hypothetical protein